MGAEDIARAALTVPPFPGASLSPTEQKAPPSRVWVPKPNRRTCKRPLGLQFYVVHASTERDLPGASKNCDHAGGPKNGARLREPTGGVIEMIARVAILIASLLTTAPAVAQSMSAEAARRFVTGKLFAFSCFDGSRGLGQIYNDGAVIGTIQFSGSGPARSIWLPPGTLKVKGDAVCATLKGLSFEPCFNVSRTGEQSFRGSLSGLGSIAHCDFVRRS
jgi:hypothetical protein